jgi:hypothetical protein
MEQIIKTRRWSDDEYMVVSGLKVVYTVDKKTGQLLVRMPGGTTKSVEELRNQGRSVMMPTTLRVD